MQTPLEVQTPVSPRPQTYNVLRIDEIREGINSIATSDKLDKESALQVTRLFHAMEMLIRHEINSRDGTIASLRAQLDQQRLQAELQRYSQSTTQDDAVMQTPRSSSRFRR